jgi:hypothetical protein
VTRETTSAVAFLEAQRAQHAALLPQFGAEKVLSFMATSAAPGAPPAVAARRLVRVARDPAGAELVVRVAGGLPRPPARAECIAVAVADAAAFRGFQLKSHSLVDPAFAPRLHRAEGGDAVVHAPQVFTIHHGPHAADYFERIPFAEVEELAARVPFALVAVGVQANLSPRWILHHEVRSGALELFQGDALMSKTYLNVRQNPREVRIVVDVATGEGLALEGELAEFRPQDHRVAAERVLASFAGAGLKPPTRLTRLRVERTWRVAAGLPALPS